MLWHHFEIDPGTDTDDLEGVLGYLANGAHHAEPADVHVRYDITRCSSSYMIVENGRAIAEVVDSNRVLDVLYGRVHQLAFATASDRGWVRLHGAVVDLPAGRVLLSGPSGGGKTTLAARLLFDGARVGADESVVSRSGSTLPVARPFHLKPGIERAVPEFRDVFARLPSAPSGAVRAFDPARSGFHWEIVSAAVAHVVVLARTNEAATMLRPLSPLIAVSHLAAESFPWDEPASRRIAEIVRLVNGAHCWHLTAGSPHEASAALRSQFGSANPSRPHHT